MVTASTATVAVVDTGIDHTHEDLDGVFWRNQDEIRDNCIDDDDNGFVDDINGWNFVDNHGDPHTRSSTHGTECAGLIAARGDNSIGSSGVAWQVPLMDLRIFRNSRDVGSVEVVCNAFRYAIDNGARIINASFTLEGSSEALERTIRDAASKGVLIVAAAGNEGADIDSEPVYPASFSEHHDNVIAVMASDREGLPLQSSNRGKTTVELAAPGVALCTTLPSNLYGAGDLTSMATALVSGALALIWGHPKYRNADWRDVREELLDHVLPNGDLSGTCERGGNLNISFLERPK
jgi:subtilisin family serine protease